MTKKTLEEIRDKIDLVDNEIQKLIERRAQLAKDVAEIKLQNNKDAVFYRPEREAQVINKIIKRNNSLLKNKDIANIFREIISACLALEQPLKIAFLGPKGTFTQEAAVKKFGHSASTLECCNIDDAFFQVKKNNANYGIVPIENSSSGIVADSLNSLCSYDLNICGETEINISQHLMMLDKKNEIKIIYAHQQALNQCHIWLSQNYPEVELQRVASNALAAKMAKEEPNSAAIASKEAMEIYNLECVVKDIENRAINTTRFIVIGKDYIKPSGKDKTSLLVVIKHKPGALVDLLESFKKYNINMLQLARHPMPGRAKWEYIFFIDIEGHQEEEKVKLALNDVRDKSFSLNILGSYPIDLL